MFYYLLTQGNPLIYHSITERIFCNAQPNTLYAPLSLSLSLS